MAIQYGTEYQVDPPTKITTAPTGLRTTWRVVQLVSKVYHWNHRPCRTEIPAIDCSKAGSFSALSQILYHIDRGTLERFTSHPPLRWWPLCLLQSWSRFLTHWGHDNLVYSQLHALELPGELKGLTLTSRNQNPGIPFQLFPESLRLWLQRILKFQNQSNAVFYNSNQ